MKKYGFSLAEALITLLIISITIAALAPTITTRRNAALNPNLYWSAVGGGVIASGSQNNTLFGVGASPSNAHLTVGSGRANSRYALKVVGSHNPILRIEGNTTSSGAVETEGNITSEGTVQGKILSSKSTVTALGNITTNETVQGGTLSSTGDIIASDDISSENGSIKGKIEHLSSVSYLTDDESCPPKWERSSFDVCTDHNSSGGCKITTLSKCTYKP